MYSKDWFSCHSWRGQTKHKVSRSFTSPQDWLSYRYWCAHTKDYHFVLFQDDFLISWPVRNYGLVGLTMATVLGTEWACFLTYMKVIRCIKYSRRISPCDHSSKRPALVMTTISKHRLHCCLWEPILVSDQLLLEPRFWNLVSITFSISRGGRLWEA